MTIKPVTATICRLNALDSDCFPPITLLPEALLSHTSPVLISATRIRPSESPNCICSRSPDQLSLPAAAHSNEASVVRETLDVIMIGIQ